MYSLLYRMLPGGRLTKILLLATLSIVVITVLFFFGVSFY